jgi:hypothetical protein
MYWIFSTLIASDSTAMGSHGSQSAVQADFCKHWFPTHPLRYVLQLVFCLQPGHLQLQPVDRFRFVVAIARNCLILAKKSFSPQGADKYPCDMRHLPRSQAGLDGEVWATGYTPGC